MSLLDLKHQSDLKLLYKKLEQLDHYLFAEQLGKTHLWFFVEKEEPFDVFRKKTLDFFARQSEKFPSLKSSGVIFLPGYNLKSFIYNLIAVIPRATLVFLTSEKPVSTIPAWISTETDSFKAGNLRIYFFPPLTQTLSDINQKRRLAGIISQMS